MNQTPFWMKAPPMSGKTDMAPLPIGPAVSQEEAEAVNCDGVVVATSAVEVLPPEALSCINVQGLAVSTANQLKKEFHAAFGDAASVLTEAAAVQQVTDVDQTAEMAKARALRLRLRAIRCEVENVRKTQKADSLMRGKVIDGVANALKGVIEPAEAWLLEQEQFAERADKLRRDQLRASRFDQLRQFIDVVQLGAGIDLGEITPEAFDAMLEGAKMQAQLKAEAEKTAEAARLEAEEKRKAKEIEDEAERKRLAAENERLRKEQADKDAAAEVERKAAAVKQAEVDAENKRLRDDAEKAKQEERDRLYKAECERIDKERAERVEAARLAEIERKAASAPDKEKALVFLVKLSQIKAPDMITDEGHNLMVDLCVAIGGMCVTFKNRAEKEL